MDGIKQNKLLKEFVQKQYNIIDAAMMNLAEICERGRIDFNNFTLYSQYDKLHKELFKIKSLMGL